MNPYTNSEFPSRKRSFVMWLQRPLSVREMVRLLEEISRNYAYESQRSSVFLQWISFDDGEELDPRKLHLRFK
jgi:hypothetical protein